MAPRTSSAAPKASVSRLALSPIAPNSSPLGKSSLRFQVFDNCHPLVVREPLLGIKVARVMVAWQARIESESPGQIVTHEAQPLAIQFASARPKDLATFRHWRKQFVDRSDRTIVKIRAGHPYARKRACLEVGQ